jgi:hypothetical protein
MFRILLLVQILFFISACGPVLFKAVSEKKATVTKPADPTVDTTNGGGTNTGGGGTDTGGGGTDTGGGGTDTGGGGTDTGGGGTDTGGGGTDTGGGGTDTGGGGTDPGGSTPQYRTVNYEGIVPIANYKLDLIFVIDNSGSMLNDSKKLALRLSNLFSQLNTSNIDWQACLTLSSQMNTTSRGLVYGASASWIGNANSKTYILNKNSGNIQQIINDSITESHLAFGSVGSDNERLIKAASNHAYYGNFNNTYSSGCYRQQAAFSYIFISDEDENSVGGNQNLLISNEKYVPMETDDYPEFFVNNLKSMFGSNQRFTANSIIIKPGDITCRDLQQSEGFGPARYGVQFAQLSTITGGGIGSICDNDYSGNLDLFFAKIRNTMNSLTLECVPKGQITASVLESGQGSSASYSVTPQGDKLIFTPAVPEGASVKVTYSCLK